MTTTPADTTPSAATGTSPVLEIVGARKRFGATVALDGADLVLKAGDWLGLLGPNGAGKTTLIRAVSGRVRLDQGTIRLFGQAVVPGSRPAGAGERPRLGVVPQEIALYPLLTARENLEAFGAFHGLRAAELTARVHWALAWTGLEERARQLVKTFSGGMKRRLNLACGVLHQPEVVLLDEPTAGVDPQSRQRIWEMLAELRAAGASLLLTTHQLDEAQQVCARIVILDHGRAIAAGTLDELLVATVGRARRFTLRLDRAAPPTLATFLAASTTSATSPTADDAGFTIAGAEVRGQLTDIAAQLPPLLARATAAGAVVEDVEIAAPSLQAVFLHLTGRELRE